MYFWHGKCKYDHLSDGFLCILYVFFIVNCLSSFEHGGLGAIGNVHPTTFLIPIALLLWTQKTAISASLARSDRIKPNCMTPDLASICIHCCRPDWMSKANNMNWHHFGFLNFYCGGVFTSFVSIPSFHKSNAFFKHFKQNRVRAVYQ